MTIRLPLILLGALLCCVGCKSEKEIGAELVDKKLDLIDGASDALSKRGQGIGRNAAKAIGDTITGVGSGVKDSMMPPITVTVGEDLAGFKVTSANLEDGHVAHVVLAGTAPWKGGLWLEAKGGDGGQLGRAVAFLHRDLVFTEPVNLRFSFASDERLSLAAGYVLHSTPPKALVSKDADLTATQLVVEGQTVKVYVVLAKATNGSVELKALGADGAELARDAEVAPKERAADTADFFTFTFPAEANLSLATTFEVKLRPAPKKSKP